jgi:site-specific DNA recombinase
MAERYRRGKLFRARAGEVIAWKAAYGFRRIPRTGDAPAHLEIYEPEAGIARRLNTGGVPPPGGKGCWNTSSLCRILRCEAYIGRVYFNRTVTVPAARPGGRASQAGRPRDEWITIACPPIIPDELFETAAKISYDNSQWSPRRAEPGAWLLRGIVKCGRCGVGCNCQKMRGRNGTWHRYYYCRNHDPLQAGGRDRRCTERNIRAGALDEFVFGQIRGALLDPAQLLAGEQALAVAAPAPDDELLAAELARLDRKLDAAKAEHGRLIDCYQAGLIAMPELQRRATAITTRQRELQDKRTSLAGQRAELARGNRLREGIENFAQKIQAVIDELDHDQRQRLLRLLIEDVQVTGWHVKIRLRIPLDGPPSGNPGRLPPPPSPDDGSTGSGLPLSTEDRLRSLHGDDRAVVGAAGPRAAGSPRRPRRGGSSRNRRRCHRAGQPWASR